MRKHIFNFMRQQELLQKLENYQNLLLFSRKAETSLCQLSSLLNLTMVWLNQDFFFLLFCVLAKKPHASDLLLPYKQIQLFKYLNMNKTSLSFCTENHCPFLIKRQKPKDALFGDCLKSAFQNVIWIHIRGSSKHANFCQLTSSLHQPHISERSSAILCQNTILCKEHQLKNQQTSTKLTSILLSSGKALHPPEKLSCLPVGQMQIAFLTDHKELPESSNKMKILAYFLFLFPIQNYLLKFIMCYCNLT